MNFDTNKTIEEMFNEMDVMLKEQGEWLSKQPESEERNRVLEANAQLQKNHLEKHKLLMELRKGVLTDYLLIRMMHDIQKEIED